MSLNSIERALILFTVCFALVACGEPDGPQLPVEVINIGDFDSGDGCAQPSFPADQPDLFVLAVPIFLLTPSQQQETFGQAERRPGDVVEGEIPVNGATRRVRLELASVWNPGTVIHTQEFETAGNTIVDFAFVPTFSSSGRYYMKLTLCGFDCSERAVVFDVVDCATVTSEVDCAHNVPYQRTLIEGGEVVRTDSTCIDLGATPQVGSGTVVIQL